MSTATMPSVNPEILGLDGQTRDWDDVFTSRPCAAHSLTDVTEYIVRRTFFPVADRRRPHQDVASFPATSEGYGDALTAVRWLRAHTTNGYAVIDSRFPCDCRFAG